MKNIPSQFEILDAGSGDELGIIQLLKETWLDTYPNKKHNITKQDILKKDWESKERFEKWRKVIAENGKNGVFNFVAKEGNKIVGFCQFVKEKDYNELKIIYVLSEYQGKGIGKMLANKAMSLFDRNKDTIVEVVEYNRGTIGFYEKLGFVEFEKGKGHEVSNGKIMPTIKMKLENDKTKTKNTESAGGVVLNKNGEVLIVEQRDSSWSLPKGGIKPNEGKVEAAVREIEEESGISELELIKYLGKYKRYRNGLNGGDDKSELKTIYMFLFRTEQNVLKPIDPHNPIAKWINQKGVENLLTHRKDKSFFQKILNTELKSLK